MANAGHANVCRFSTYKCKPCPNTSFSSAFFCFRLQEKSGGKVPVINDGDFWLPDSDEIVKYLDEKHPESSMASDVPADVTAGFFGAFRNLLLAKPEEAEEKKNVFVQEMGKVRKGKCR